MPGKFSLPLLVNDPSMHHGTCVATIWQEAILSDSSHVCAGKHARIANKQFPFLKSVAGKTFTTFPVHVQPAILRIWLEAHAVPSKSADAWTSLAFKVQQECVGYHWPYWELSFDKWKHIQNLYKLNKISCLTLHSVLSMLVMWHWYYACRWSSTVRY